MVNKGDWRDKSVAEHIEAKFAEWRQTNPGRDLTEQTQTRLRFAGDRVDR